MANPVFLTEEEVRRPLAPEYDTTESYAVGQFVWHRGDIYQCDQVNGQTDPHEPTGGSSDAYWHVAKLDDFFRKSDSSQTELKNSLLQSAIDARVGVAVGDVNEVLAAALDGSEVA